MFSATPADCFDCNPLAIPMSLILQVTLNQLALAPVTLAAVFTWNSVLTGQSEAIPGKIQKDLVPSMINGESLSYQ